MTATETGYHLAARLGVYRMTSRCRGQKADLTLMPTSVKGTDGWRIATHAYYSCSVCGSTHSRSQSTIRRHAEQGETMTNITEVTIPDVGTSGDSWRVWTEKGPDVIATAGLDYVSTVVSCYDGRTGLTDVYEITGIPRHDDDLNRLDVTLTTDQYVLLQVTLRRAQTDRTRTSVHSLEIERLITIFAEAAASQKGTSA